MSRLTTWTFLAHLFISSSVAVNLTEPTCSDLGGLRRPNASTTRQIPAFSISGNQSIDFMSFRKLERFAVENDTSRTWSLSLHVHGRELNSPSDKDTNGVYRQTLLLDTVDSNVTQLGVCHQTVQAHGTYSGFHWTKKVLERGLKDTGDCRTMLGDKCVNALTEQYRMDALESSLKGSCLKPNNTVPAECAGMMEPRTQAMNMTHDLSHYDVRGVGNTTRRFDSSVKCDGVNASSNHFWEANSLMYYDTAVRFPLVHIMTFWPIRAKGLTSMSTSWIKDVRVAVVCMRPDNVAQGSQVPPSGEELLNKEGTKFQNITGADALSAADMVMPRHGVWVWASAMAISIMFAL